MENTLTLNAWFRGAVDAARDSIAGCLTSTRRSDFAAPFQADVGNDQRAARHRYCATLTADPPGPIGTRVAAWKQLEERTGLVPAGEVYLAASLETGEDPSTTAIDHPYVVATQAIYLDRYAVSNAQFAEFVADGGYNQQQLWPSELLPRVLQFVDKTGCPGPRFWSGGKSPAQQRDHPVVGISWFEANAYARWSGQRLPTAAEWQRAASWFSDGTPHEMQYPWGKAFDPKRCNTWHSRRGKTAPVHEYAGGSTPNGICQLIGNTWEWTGDGFDGGEDDHARIFFERTHAEIRGGAYDTYLETQATSHFRTGQPLLQREANVGFRGCITARDLPESPDPSALMEL